MDTIIYIILFIATGGAVTATEVRVYRTACLAATASRERQIADAHTVYLGHLADGLRDNLTPDDVRFLRTNGWEPVTPRHRQLARGVSPLPGLGATAIEAPRTSRPPLDVEQTFREARAWARGDYEIHDKRGRPVYTLGEDL